MINRHTVQIIHSSDARETRRLLPNALTYSCLRLIPQESSIDLALIPAPSIDRLVYQIHLQSASSYRQILTRKCISLTLIPAAKGITDLRIYLQLICFLNAVFAKWKCETRLKRKRFADQTFNPIAFCILCEISYRPDRAHSFKITKFYTTQSVFPIRKKKKLSHQSSAQIMKMRELAYLRSQMRNVREFIVITQTTWRSGCVYRRISDSIAQAFLLRSTGMYNPSYAAVRRPAFVHALANHSE